MSSKKEKKAPDAKVPPMKDNMDRMEDDEEEEEEEEEEEQEKATPKKKKKAAAAGPSAPPSKPDSILEDLQRWDQQHGIGPDGRRIHSSSSSGSGGSRRSSSKSSRAAPAVAVAAAAAAASSSSSSSSPSLTLNDGGDGDDGDAQLPGHSSESESDGREDDDGGSSYCGGDDIAGYFHDLARHQKRARKQRRHPPTVSSTRPAPLDPADPLWLVLPLVLIDLRHAQGLEPVPRDLVHLIFSYAEPRELSYELKWRKQDWRDEEDGPTQAFDALEDALPVMAKNMPDIQEQPEDTPGGQAQDQIMQQAQMMMQQQQQQGRGRRIVGGYKRWGAVYEAGGPLHTQEEMPEWDMMLDGQACRDEFVSDSHFDPPLIDTARRDKIRASGRVPIPVTRIRLYQRLRARLLAGRFPSEPHAALEEAVATLGHANGRLFEHEWNNQHFLYCKQIATVEYGKWSLKDEKEYFRDGGDYE